ncbi:MAG: hypothetical protein CMH63_03595 [Nanoarchaeota archaeon]|jgi:predicted Zn-ribbon and HTH transcriptional regulator|nr:hypothetical protein [Nanoarchaeota archaeon]|tara:strand:- start:6403 stop:6849 length:447 start_codon:yes stop_codon:yes gene_type:complete
MTELMCKSCKNPVALSDLKADKSGSGWVCMDCYKHQHPEVYKLEGAETPKEKTRIEELPVKLTKYHCSECGYKFKKEPNYKDKCPYCNLYSVKEEKDANTLLKDSIKDLGIDHISGPRKEKGEVNIVSSAETKIEDSSPEPKIEIVDD